MRWNKSTMKGKMSAIFRSDFETKFWQNRNSYWQTTRRNIYLGCMLFEKIIWNTISLRQNAVNGEESIFSNAWKFVIRDGASVDWSKNVEEIQFCANYLTWLANLPMAFVFIYIPDNLADLQYRFSKDEDLIRKYQRNKESGEATNTPKLHRNLCLS